MSMPKAVVGMGTAKDEGKAAGGMIREGMGHPSPSAAALNLAKYGSGR